MFTDGRWFFATVVAMALAGAGIAAQQTNINQRPTSVTAKIDKTKMRYAGTFELAERSRICGEIPPEQSMTGERAFIVEFPDTPPPDSAISNFSFGSKVLVGNTTSATKFMLEISVRGSAQAYRLNTDRPKNSGTATIETKAGTSTLKVSGANEMGETIELTVVCRPK